MGRGCSQKKGDLYSFIQFIWLPSQGGQRHLYSKCKTEKPMHVIATKDKSVNHKPTTLLSSIKSLTAMPDNTSRSSDLGKDSRVGANLI